VRSSAGVLRCFVYFDENIAPRKTVMKGNQMPKETMVNSPANTTSDDTISVDPPPLDSKYRLIIVAAQRSKQLQRGARPRVEMASQRHKHTRVALEEISQGKINYKITDNT